MALLRLKIDILRSFLYNRLILNDYNTNEFILSISQLLDVHIVQYEELKVNERVP